jgi:hypothetical protein
VTDLDLLRKGARRPRIYVSGPMAKAPYTGPRAAFSLARELWLVGWHPIVPHANALFETSSGPLDTSSVDGCNGWLEYDFSMLADSEAIVRVSRDGMGLIASSGTDREHALAHEISLLILTEEQALRGPPTGLGTPDALHRRANYGDAPWDPDTL